MLAQVSLAARQAFNCAAVLLYLQNGRWSSDHAEVSPKVSLLVLLEQWASPNANRCGQPASWLSLWWGLQCWFR